MVQAIHAVIMCMNPFPLLRAAFSDLHDSREHAAYGVPAIAFAHALFGLEMYHGCCFSLGLRIPGPSLIHVADIVKGPLGGQRPKQPGNLRGWEAITFNLWGYLQ